MTLTLLQAEPMTGLELLGHETIKAIPTAVIAGIGALLAVWVGKRVSHLWAVRQKQREIELTALNEVYRLYGEFISLRRLWNQYKKPGYPHLRPPADSSWQFLERAADLEARMEAVLIKVAAERTLCNCKGADIDRLGLLRQAFQSLRQRIRDNEPVSWGYSDHEEYVELKSQASRLAAMLLSDAPSARPSAKIALKQIMDITDNRHEKRWQEVSAREAAKPRHRSDQADT